MTVLVGVDAGGSHTEVVVCCGTDLQLRRRGQFAAITAGSVTDSAATIAGLIGDVLLESKLNERAGAIVVGAAGAGRSEERDALERSLASRLSYDVALHVTTDGAIALESAFPNKMPGMLLISGTGSVAFARDTRGRIFRTGGLGWQLGDEGSGYSLGRAALGAVGRAAENRGPGTLLSERIAAATASNSVAALVGWAATADTTSVAALAREVLIAAGECDAVAVELVADAARKLVDHVRVLVSKFPSDAPPPELALSGGLLHQDSLLRAELVELLASTLPGVRLSLTTVDPAMGAVSLAAALVRHSEPG
ncbi:MAG: BadF/BadG/BcrA/BcrD ATPase family protein [Gemmatimonadales bacterium]